ncbi:MAG: phosphoribosyltransferase family protein [Porphyromonas sp.]|nr:phosphoribosyltransferase family protein [Porphyromonas sp.]
MDWAGKLRVAGDIGRHILRHLVELALPSLCPACGDRLQAGELGLCSYCARQLSPYRPVLHYAEERLWSSRIFGQHYSVYAYRMGGIEQRMIHAFKYHHHYAVARLISERARVSLPLAEQGYDLILAIPLSRERFAKRGYNQALVLARYLAEWLGCEASDKHIIRPRHSKSHARLSGIERRMDSAELFEPNPKRTTDWPQRRILVVDDVLTTGATMLCYLNILERLGARNVDVFTATTAVR